MAWTHDLIELHNIIANLYQDTNDCRRIAQDSGLDITRIHLDNLSVRNQWHNILNEADKCERLGMLVDRVAKEYENHHVQLYSFYENHAHATTFIQESELLQNGDVSPFHHACFISCFQATDPLTQRIVTEFRRGLEIELNIWRDENIYLDESRLAPQHLYSEDTATALCRSACMVIVFTPKYFSAKYVYCVREYLAMKELEEYRLKVLGAGSLRHEGLIIPVVFRGDVPDEISNQRTCHKFDNFTLSSREMYLYDRFTRKIEEIAEYIHDRCNALASIPEAFSICDGFVLPSMIDAQNYLHLLRPPKKLFPLR